MKLFLALPDARTFASVVASLFLANAHAHNLDTTATSISFADDYVQTMGQRAAANEPLIQQNDEFWVILKTTPGPGTQTGVGGYQTFYIPQGVVVTDAAYVFPDSSDPRGFRNIPIKGQSPIAIGNGSIGAATSPEFVGWQLPGFNGLGVKFDPVTQTGAHRGTLAGVYGDTGIFYSTDPRTVFNGYGMLKPPLVGPPAPMKNNSGDTVGEWYAANIADAVPREVLGVMSLWDSHQLRAYGRADVSPLLDSNGRGNAPWGMANVVPGPESGYAWEFDYDAYEAAFAAEPNLALKKQAGLRAAVKIGPWNRIQYPGSQISSDQPGLISNVLGQAGVDASLMGIPATAIPPDATAVRFAIGQLELGRPEVSAVKVRIVDAPAAGDCWGMHADAFGGDAGGTDGGKDHIWRYFDPTVVTLKPCAFLQKVASKTLVAPGETFYYDITFANNGNFDFPNVTITDVLPSGLVHVSAQPVPSSGSGSTWVWNLGTVAPGDFITIRQYVKATGSGTLFNTATARSNGNVVGVAKQSVEVGVRAILDKSKSVTPEAAAPGQMVAYTLNVENIGTGPNGVPLRVREFLPAGFTFQSLVGATLNGATISSPTIVVNSTNPAQPLFAIAQSIEPAKKLVITFTALIDPSVQPGTYWNSFQLEYEGKVVPPIPEAPVTVAGGKIGDTVYRDWDGDGTQDAGEPGIAGVLMTLEKWDGSQWGAHATTTTDSNGKYFFNGLIDGQYRVTATQPANTTQTGDPDGTADNQHVITLGEDEQYFAADFGYLPTGSGSIGDFVFQDIGNDGTPSASDPGIPGVTLTLYADTNGDGILTPGTDALIGTTTSAANGAYIFNNLATGFNYLVAVDANDPDLASYFSPDPYQISTASLIAVPNLSGSFTTADFGFWQVQPGTIGDTVFIDANGNGIYDAGDGPLGGVTVNLLRDGVPIASATTAPDGTYLFQNLGPGTYTVAVDATDPQIPAGYTPSTASHQVSLAAGQQFLTADFPFTPLISKSVDKAYAITGQSLNFGVNVNYTGGNLLSDVTIRDYLPLGTTFNSAGQGGVLQTFNSTPGTAGTDSGSAGNGSVTLNSVSGIDDTWLNADQVARNYGGSNELRVDSEGSKPERALVRFVLPNNLPADAVVTSAVLKLTKLSGNTIDIVAHQADNAWTEGTLNDATGVASWNDRITATPWDTAGGDYIEDPNDPVVSSGTATGDRNWQVAHIVQNWLEGVPNHGFLLKNPLENSGNNSNAFASSENTTVASRPILTITYTSTARPGTSNTISVSPTVGAVGSPFTVTMTVQATQNVNNVVPSALQVSGGSATVSGPTPASRNLTANTPATFTWTVTPNSKSEFSFSASASNGTVNFLPATSNSALASPNGENQYVVWNLGSNDPGTTGVTAQNKYLYAFGGNDTLTYWAYNTANSTWNNPLNPTDTPAGFTVFSGGALTNDGTRYIYALRGDTTRAFARYDALNNTWDDAGIADLPGTTDKAVLKGGSLVYLNGFVYAFIGNDSLQFWRYSVAGNSWTQMANALGTVNNGAGLTTDGTNLYATQGDGKKGFWRYNVAANTWTLLAPFADSFGDGGGLVYANGAIYVLRGGRQTSFRRYNIAANTWTTLTAVPANIDDGGAIAFDGTSIYVMRGKSNVFYRYNIGTGTGGLGTWDTLANTPATIGWGGALTFLATGNVSFTSSTATTTLVMGSAKQVVVRMTVTADSAINNISANTAPTFTAPAGTTVSFSQPAGILVSNDDDIAGTGDPVIYQWIATVTPGSTPGEIVFTTTNSTGGSSLTNTVLVSPTLTYTATVASSPPSVIENTAFVQDFSGTIDSTPSNITETATAASIGDFVWADLDGDGIQDAGEFGIGGVTVTLKDSNGNVVATTVTDSFGGYRFFGLAAGSYTVTYDASTAPAGYFATTATTVPVTLTTGQQFNDADFGLTVLPPGTGSIGDFVWLDANNDGIKDSGEDGLPAITVILERLIAGEWIQIATTETDETGFYQFSGLSAAEYRVTIDTSSEVTSPFAVNPPNPFELGDVMAPTWDLDSGLANPNGVTLVTLTTNDEVVTNADFGFNWSGSIGDLVWWDDNTNGLPDGSPTEGGVFNARIQLYFDSDGDGVIDRTLGDYEILRVFTDANGYYFIPNLPPGNYIVDVYEDSLVEGDGIRNVVPTTEDNIVVTLGAGSMNVDTADFGYYIGARVEALIFWDENQNSVRDPGEVLLPGITVTLTGTDKSGNPVTVTGVTTDTGYISFLVPEGNYTISYDTAQLNGLFPALGTPTTVTSIDFEAVAGEDGWRFFDFGVDNTGAIGDTIFADLDGTSGPGVGPGSGDPGLAGVTVNLYLDQNGDGVIDYNAGDLLLATALTDAQGNYLFTGLLDTTGTQEYLVEVLGSTIPLAYQQTATSYPTGADTANNRFSTTLLNGQAVLTADFGYPLVPDVFYAVSGTIYDDNGNGGGAASNGAQEIGESGIANVKVTIEIDEDNNGSYELSYVVFTDSNGDYSFSAIPEGANVRITVDQSTLPSTAYVQTGDPDGAPLSNVWTITDIQANATNLDFGYIEQLGSIAGTVVVGGGNGIAESGEDPVANVTVTLTWSGLDGIPGTADDVQYTTTTDSSGFYEFPDLLPGGYEITTDISSGLLALADRDGFNPNSINVNLGLGQDVTGRDFEYQSGSLAGYLWKDFNTDGIRDAGEPPIIGATVFLDLDGNGQLDAGEPSTTTDSLGFYQFDELAADTYQVRVDPLGFVAGSFPSYDLDGIDSPNLAVVSLSPNQALENVNFGYSTVPPVAMNDQDLDNVIGSAVTLDILSNDTASDGLNLIPSTVKIVGTSNPGDPLVVPGEGTWTVNTATGEITFTPETGFTGNPTPISYTVKDNQGNTSNVATVTVTYLQLGAISGTVWEDSDADDIGDTPIEGVILSLVDANGNPVLDGNNQPFTTVSAADGTYSFGNLPPGTYGVMQMPPSGYVSLLDKDGDDPNEIRPITVVAGETNEDNDFVLISGCPSSWAHWLQLHPGETASGDPDADAYDNFAEFAFAMPYDQGAGSQWLGSTAWVIQPSSINPHTIEGVFVRPKGAPLNVTYTLQYASALGAPTVWQEIVITPSTITTVDNGDCTETVTIHDLESLTGLTSGEGIVRIKAELDENAEPGGIPDGITDHTSYTEVEGWTETDFGICCKTYNVPYLLETQFTGTVSSVDEQSLVFTGQDLSSLSALLASGTYYLEVTYGDHEGHRFDVDSISGNGIVLENDSDLYAATAPFNTMAGAPPSTLAGDTVALRRHRTLDEILPPGGFDATGDEETADEVQVYANGLWTIYWLYDENDADPSTSRWVDLADGLMRDMGGTIIPPGQGLFFNNRVVGSETTLLAYGEVRENDFVRPLRTGNSLVGGGYPIDQSALDRSMTLAEGFFGSRDFKTADSFFIWKGDAVNGRSGYDSYFLINGAPLNPALIRWARVGDSTATPRDEEVLLLRNRAVFVRSKDGMPEYTMPSPWAP